MTTARAIQDFLAAPAMAVVGVSRSGRKFGNAACRTLREKGYRIYPIHPSATSLNGEPCYARLRDLPEAVSSVLVVVPPRKALEVMRDAAAAGARHVWLQQGAESPEAYDLAASLGIGLVAGECILMFAKPTGIHRAHRTIRRVVSGLPA
jgi:uncharacterized protein